MFCLMVHSSQVIDELTSHGSSLCVAYFYCSIGNTASQVSENVLGSLVAQLSGANPSILNHIRAVYNQTPTNQAHRSPIDIGALEKSIIQCSSGEKQVVILVDAVNESQNMENIERSLLRLAKSSRNIRVVVTTTTTMISAKHDDALKINISAKMMRGDIAAFIGDRLEQDDILRNLPPKFKDDIEKALLDNADGSSVYRNYPTAFAAH